MAVMIAQDNTGDIINVQDKPSGVGFWAGSIGYGRRKGRPGRTT